MIQDQAIRVSWEQIPEPQSCLTGICARLLYSRKAILKSLLCVFLSRPMTGNFFFKSQIINMLVFVDQTVCVTTQFYF